MPVNKRDKDQITIRENVAGGIKVSVVPAVCSGSDDMLSLAIVLILMLPVKIRVGMCKMSGSFFVQRLGPNH